jgi:dTDP-4-dehydrorhamnose reductase
LIGAGPITESLARAAASRGIAVQRVHDTAQAVPAIGKGEAWAVIVEPPSSRQLHSPERALGALRSIARACAKSDARLLVFSSDRVFDGSASEPYVESDEVRPACAQGRFHQAIEASVTDELERALIIRTGPLLVPNGFGCPVNDFLSALRKREPGFSAEDELVSPTFLPHAEHPILDLLLDEESGVWHVANSGAVSWRELLTTVAREARAPAFGWDTSDDAPASGPRRRMRVLSSARGSFLPSVEHALEGYVSSVVPQLRAAIR